MSRPRRHRKGGRTTPKGTRPRGQRPGHHRPPAPDPYDLPWADEPEAPDLLDQVADALDDGHPMPLLAVASSILNVCDPRSGDPMRPSPELDLEEVLGTFFATDEEETTALLAAIATVSGDDLLRRRVRKEVALRGDPLPAWLEQASSSTIGGLAVITDAYGDEDTHLVGVDLPTGEALTAVVTVDVNLGGAVTEGLVVPADVDEVLASASGGLLDDPHVSVAEPDHAAARARLVDGIDHGARFLPPFESDTWPACRPLVEWMVGLLPPGGTVPEWEPMPDEEQTELRRRFFASEPASALSEDEHAHLVENLLWFATGYGDGDPLRWSPARVSELLLDWIPRKIVSPPELLSPFPDVLRAFVRFADAERERSPGLTDGTLAAIDELEGDYQRSIRTPRHQGPTALLERMGVPVGDPPEPTWSLDMQVAEIMLDRIAEEVGHDQLLTFDDQPLPEVDIDLGDLDTSHRERVTEVLTLIDDAGVLFDDPEIVTATRRLLADVLAGDPAVLARGQARGAAGVLLWIVAKANDAFDSTAGGSPQVADLYRTLGIGSGGVGNRAPAVLSAVGLPLQEYGGMDLRTTRYLTARRRADLIEMRERYLAALDDGDDG